MEVREDVARRLRQLGLLDKVAVMVAVPEEHMGLLFVDGKLSRAVLMLAAPGLVLASFARAWGTMHGQVFAALVLALVAVYAGVGAALLRAPRGRE